MNQVKITTRKVLCQYHKFFMNIARIIKSEKLRDKHRELYEQSSYAYGRYEFLQKK